MTEVQDQPKPLFPAQPQYRPGLESEPDPRPDDAAAEYKSAGKLQDRVALITGGDSGIGRAVAVLFAREGADVAIVYYSDEQRDYYANAAGVPLPPEQNDVEETRNAIEAEGRRALLLPGDVSDPDFCRKVVERTVGEFGRLDVLVNNAAFQPPQPGLEALSDEQWDHTFKTSIDGYFHLCQAALPHLAPGSAIINTSSITGFEGSRHRLDYATTRGAINAFTKSLAQHLTDQGIRVNAIAPGPVWTPLQRLVQPEEIAPAYVFFASQADSSYITGEVLTLTGGATTAA